MKAALAAVVDGIGFTWRLGGAVVHATIAGALGMVAGLVIFALLGLLVPNEWGGAVWSTGIILSGVGSTLLSLRRSFRRPVLSDAMGSAAWADARQVAAELATPALVQNPAALLIGRAADRRGMPLRYAGPAHLLTVAPTRSGKGVGTVLPNLLTIPRPVICIDPKGENARIAARARRRFGPVWVLDPFGVSGQPAAAYDPAAVLDPLSSDLADDAATLADALVFDPPGQVAEAHWNEEAKALIAGLLLHLATRPPGEPRGLSELRRLLTLPPRDLEALLHALMADTGAAGGLVARAAARQLGKADREAAGVLSSAQRHTHFLDSPRLAAAMSRADFRWQDLRNGTATVFLVLPPDRLGSYARWLRLLVAQAIAELARTPQRPGTPPVLLLLDEFAALGRLEPVLQAAGLMAGLGLQLWPILQDLAQLRAAYGSRPRPSSPTPAWCRSRPPPTSTPPPCSPASSATPRWSTSPPPPAAASPPAWGPVEAASAMAPPPTRRPAPAHPRRGHATAPAPPGPPPPRQAPCPRRQAPALRRLRVHRTV